MHCCTCAGIHKGLTLVQHSQTARRSTCRVKLINVERVQLAEPLIVIITSCSAQQSVSAFPQTVDHVSTADHSRALWSFKPNPRTALSWEAGNKTVVQTNEAWKKHCCRAHTQTYVNRTYIELHRTMEQKREKSSQHRAYSRPLTKADRRLKWYTFLSY